MTWSRDPAHGDAGEWTSRVKNEKWVRTIAQSLLDADEINGTKMFLNVMPWCEQKTNKSDNSLLWKPALYRRIAERCDPGKM